MRGKPERLAQLEFCCPNCKREFLVGAFLRPRPEEVIETQREKLKSVCSTPIPRIDIENGHEIYDGNEDQRFRTRAEVQSQLELHDKRFPKRESARRAWK